MSETAVTELQGDSWNLNPFQRKEIEELLWQIFFGLFYEEAGLVIFDDGLKDLYKKSPEPVTKIVYQTNKNPSECVPSYINKVLKI